MKILSLILTISLRGSIVFFLYYIIKKLTERYFNKSWHYRFLVLNLLLFLLPFSLPNVFNVQLFNNFKVVESREDLIRERLEHKSKTHKKDFMSEEINNKDTIFKEELLSDENLIKNKRENFKTNRSLGLEKYTNLVVILILLIAILNFTYRLLSYFIFKDNLFKSSRLVTDPEILNLFKLSKAKLDIKKGPTLRVAKKISSPILIGLTIPTIFINSQNLDFDKQSLIFIHELNHYKRKDILIKFLLLFARSIHWFNPLIYIFERELNTYCEYSIDEIIVSNMELDDRKKYAGIILNMASSNFNSLDLTTGMSSPKEELKLRLENIVYSFKSSKKTKVLSLLIGFLVILFGIYFSASLGFFNKKDLNKSAISYLKDDGIYYMDLSSSKETKIQEGKDFDYPLISDDGSYIAYTKGKNIYIYDISKKEYKKVSDDEIEHYYRSYVWLENNFLVYGSNSITGLNVLDLKSGKIKTYKDNSYYTSMIVAKDKSVYARRVDKEDSKKSGIVKITLDNFNDGLIDIQLMIASKVLDSKDIKSNLVPWFISDNSKTLYVMNKPESGSLSSDYNSLVIYNLEDDELKEIEELDFLAYKNQFSIDGESNIIAGIEGGGRELIDNKRLVLLKVNYDGSYDKIYPNNIESLDMTPKFSVDGDKLYYASSNFKVENIDLDNYSNWRKLGQEIYSYNIQTKEIDKITKDNKFNLLPTPIAEEDLIYLRYDGKDKYSLFRIKDKKQTKLVKNLSFTGSFNKDTFEYYGHLDSERAFDIYIDGKFKNDEEEMDKLYNMRGTYLGDNSKVVSIVNMLNFPADMNVEKIDLSTKDQPFGLTVTLQGDANLIAKYISTSSNYLWYPQAFSLFSLIKNLDYVEFNIKEETDRETSVFYITREQADSLIGNDLGFKINKISENKDYFRDFYKYYYKDYSYNKDKIEGLVGHIVIEDNKLNLKEVTIVEWDDKEKVKSFKLSDDDFINSYKVIEKSQDIKKIPINDSCIYTFTDVNLLFSNKPDSNRSYGTVIQKEFLNHLAEYSLNDIDLDEQRLIYFVEVKDDKVISIVEKFKYTI